RPLRRRPACLDLGAGWRDPAYGRRREDVGEAGVERDLPGHRRLEDAALSLRPARPRQGPCVGGRRSLDPHLDERRGEDLAGAEGGHGGGPVGGREPRGRGPDPLRHQVHRSRARLDRRRVRQDHAYGRRRRGRDESVWHRAKLGQDVLTWRHGISYSDQQHGWLVGGYGLIYRTTDAGKSWLPSQG